MGFVKTGCRRGRAPFRALAAGALLLFLFLAALSVSPALHHAFHKDSDHRDHACAVTIFAHGQVELVVYDVPIVVSQVWAGLHAVATVFVSSEPPELLPPERAPPFCA